jgi:aminoglycoside phosphotransferase family enzyme
MDSAAERAFLESYRRTTGDNGIAVRLPFYRAAYLAFRGAYALMAAGQLSDTPDGDRFRAAARRYRSRLQQLLHG